MNQATEQDYQLGPTASHRPEVDGLRALAVLPVIYFHAGFDGLPGGFLGVDLFFVISGYLISRILLLDLASGRFSLVNFYERRARRILPALFLVMAFTAPLAWILMPPDSLRTYFGSLWATAIFGSNVFFWRNNGYFQPAAELQPLLHTWSLAVEEQFYLFFPLGLAAMYKTVQRHLITIVATLCIVSFMICIWQTSRNADASFYLIHARAWELGVGTLVALAEVRGKLKNVSQRVGSTLSLMGLALIVAGFLVVKSVDALPGAKTIFPVAGAALVLAFTRPGSIAHSLLKLRPMVGVGLISYSAYLWHHPIFAFARLWSLDEPSNMTMLALAAASLVLAYLTWWLVEMPWRDKSWIAQSNVFKAVTAATCIAVGIGLAAQELDWANSKVTREQTAAMFPALSTAEDCSWERPDVEFTEIAICRFGASGDPRPVLLWGDSHARALKDQLHEKLKQMGRGAIYVDGHSCLRMPGIYRDGLFLEKRARHCADVQEAVFGLLETENFSQVLLSLRWTLQLFPVPGAGAAIGYDNGEGGRESETDRRMLAKDSSGRWSVSPDGKRIAIEQLVNRLSRLAPVTIVGPVPEVGWNVGETNFKTMYLHGKPKPDISTSAERFKRRNAFVIGVLQHIESEQSARVVWPHELFCNTEVKGRCVAQREGISYYSDDDHLSASGAKLVLDAAFDLPD